MFWICRFHVLQENDTQEMIESASPRSKDDPNVPHLYLFYHFPINVSADRLSNYNNRFSWLYNRDFTVSRKIDWVWLANNGIMKRIKPYLTKVCLGVRGRGICL